MKKNEAKHTWIKQGLKPEQFEHAWEQREQSICCDWCKNKYKSSRDKQMDHSHKDDEYYEKGDFRNILCHNCNNWRRTDTKFIRYRTDNERYRVEVHRNGKNIVNKNANFITKEEAEARLLQFKEDNPEYFIPDFILV